MRIWIDLANTPNVLFFEPVIRALERDGHLVTVTMRRFANTVPLARARGVCAQEIGAGHDASRDEAQKRKQHHRRVAELVAFAGHRFDVAVSHGSHTQAAAAHQLGLPALVATDFEHPGLGTFRHARCFMVPSLVPAAALEPFGIPAAIVRHYEGLKEHVYLSDFRPTADLRQQLAIDAARRLVVFRPIADHAMYTDNQGDGVQRRVVEHLASAPDITLLVLPRTDAQAGAYEALSRRLPAIRVLREVVDGPSLICAADLVVCGGGTMLREAAVLGVPAVSIFSGRHGAVDRWLASQGLVTLVRSEEDVARLHVAPRPPRRTPSRAPHALAQIVQAVYDTAAAG
jgi:hypothetical protein